MVSFITGILPNVIHTEVNINQNTLIYICINRKGLYAGTATAALGICGALAYCAEGERVSPPRRRIVYDMTEDHISTLENHPDMQLKFVQVIFRHGARTPLSEIKSLEPVSFCVQV